MNILRHIRTTSNTKTISLFVRNFYFRKVQKGCECPEPPKDKIVQEKSCIPCSFLTWKPKSRKVIEYEVKESMKPKPPMRCYAGMVIRKPPPQCNADDIDPFQKNPCCKEKEPEPKIAAAKPPKKQLPYSDWDADC